VIHIASGISGLMSSIVVGNRAGFNDGKDPLKFEPHNILFTYVGLCMLWVGWLGFNGGSAMGANPRAAYAVLCTIVSPCLLLLFLPSVKGESHFSPPYLLLCSPNVRSQPLHRVALGFWSRHISVASPLSLA
jgi:hypothetical protein